MLAVAPDPIRASDEAYLQKLGEVLTLLREKFGHAVYLMLSPSYAGQDRFVFAAFAAVAAAHRVPLLASNQPLYHLPDRRSPSDVMTAMREHVEISQAGFRLAANSERHLKTGRETVRLFADYPEAIAILTIPVTRAFWNSTTRPYLERATWKGCAGRWRPSKESAATIRCDNASQASSNKAGRFFLDRWHPLSQKADVNGHV